VRVSTLLTVIPVVVVAGVIAIANRELVRFSVDPFTPENPALSLDLPLYFLVFIAFLAGVLLGGFAAWWRKSSLPRRSSSRAIAPLS